MYNFVRDILEEEQHKNGNVNLNLDSSLRKEECHNCGAEIVDKRGLCDACRSDS
jgi:hypothetical protein